MCVGAGIIADGELVPDDFRRRDLCSCPMNESATWL